MRLHLPVPFCVAALVPAVLIKPAPAAPHGVAPPVAVDVIASPQPDGIWVAVVAIAALAVSRPTGGKPGR